MPVDASKNLCLSGILSRLVLYRLIQAEYLACSENIPEKEKSTQKLHASQFTQATLCGTLLAWHGRLARDLMGETPHLYPTTFLDPRELAHG